MTIRTASLEGLSLYSTLAISAKNKISIFCGVDNRLVTFYVTKYEENDNQTVIVVDSVKVYKGRIPEGAITDIYPLYVNPLNTKEPTVYLASSCGDIFVYIPTSKIESKYSQVFHNMSISFCNIITQQYLFKYSHTINYCSITCRTLSFLFYQ